MIRKLTRKTSGPAVQPLEARRLLTVAFQIDYSLDTSGFFSVQSHRDALSYAASQIGSQLNDHLLAVPASGGNSYSLVFDSPATGQSITRIGPNIAADTILLYVAARDVSGAELGIGGPTGYSASGSQSFFDLLQGRGQIGATLATGKQTDTAPLAGAITFDSMANWSFDTASPPTNSSLNDFVSVAQHEITHALGIGLADSWKNLIVNQTFNGTQAKAVYGGPVPVQPVTAGHFAAGTISPGQGEAAMAPSLTQGTRKVLTQLDFAALNDIGWEVSGFASTDTTPPIITLVDGAAQSNGTIVINITATDNVGLTGDILATQLVFNRDTDALAFNVTSIKQTASTTTTRSYAVTVAIPNQTISAATAGDYHLRVAANAIADPAGNQSAATSLGKFTLTAQVVTPPPPTVDLAAAAISGGNKLSTKIGAKNTLKFSVKSLGTATFVSTANLSLVLSLDTTASSGDITLGKSSGVKLNLKPNSSIPFSFTALTPAVPVDGTYHLLATVTAIADTNRSNNTLDLGTFNLQKSKPDLAVTFYKPPGKLPASRTVTLTLRLTNTGNIDLNQAATVKLFAATSINDKAPKALKTVTLPKTAILRGKFATVQVTVTVPKNRIFIARLTPTDANAANNAASLSFT